MRIRVAQSLFATARGAIAVAIFSAIGAGAASAYVGPSFLQVPGVAGGWQGATYKDWVKAEAQYWDGVAQPRSGTRKRPYYGGPAAPRAGAGRLAISLDKRSPALPGLMEACAKKTKIAELSYAESSERNRALTDVGDRPADVPEYFEYKLKDAQLECPVVAEALEQAFVVSFKDIQWLNYQGEGRELKLEPAKLKPAQSAGASKAYVVEWMALAHDVSDDQCPKINEKPAQEEYYTFLSKADAAKERAEFGEKGVAYNGGQMERRGPSKLNVCKLPGIVRDPGHFSPQTALARGLNLDADDGNGAPAAVCKHSNFVSADGRHGIDNQLYKVQGCMPGYMGHKGFYYQYVNEQRRNGLLAILLEISGIDDEQNDDNVTVTMLYSKDSMAKDATGAKILPHYTFTVTAEPNLTHYFSQVRGRIVNGVVLTEPVEMFKLDLGLDIEIQLHQAAMRLEFAPDGAMKGVIGGYLDWRRAAGQSMSSQAESLYGHQCPGVYNAFKRAADGMKDPVTGECNGISAAYDIEAVPAFIPPSQRKALMAQASAPQEQR